MGRAAWGGEAWKRSSIQRAAGWAVRAPQASGRPLPRPCRPLGCGTCFVNLTPTTGWVRRAYGAHPLFSPPLPPPPLTYCTTRRYVLRTGAAGLLPAVRGAEAWSSPWSPGYVCHEMFAGEGDMGKRCRTLLFITPQVYPRHPRLHAIPVSYKRSALGRDTRDAKPREIPRPSCPLLYVLLPEPRSTETSSHNRAENPIDVPPLPWHFEACVLLKYPPVLPDAYIPGLHCATVSSCSYLIMPCSPNPIIHKVSRPVPPSVLYAYKRT